MRLDHVLGPFVAGVVATLLMVYLAVVLVTGPREFGGGIRIENDRQQRKLVEQLEKKGIDFRVGEDGSIHYRKENSEEVKEIVYRVMGTRGPDKIVLRFPSDEARVRFVKELERKGVEVAVAGTEHGGKVVVDKEDKEKWEPIFDEVLKETRGGGE